MMSRLVITFLPRSKCLLISWLQSPSAVIFEPPKIKSDTASTVSPSISHGLSISRQTQINSFIYSLTLMLSMAWLSAVDIKMCIWMVLASRGGTNQQTDNYDIKLPTVWQHDLMERGFAKEGRGPSFGSRLWHLLWVVWLGFFEPVSSSVNLEKSTIYLLKLLKGEICVNSPCHSACDRVLENVWSRAL